MSNRLRASVLAVAALATAAGIWAGTWLWEVAS